jgi:hypothetical protein
MKILLRLILVPLDVGAHFFVAEYHYPAFLEAFILNFLGQLHLEFHSIEINNLGISPAGGSGIIRKGV